jgi:lipid II:glycine glycyltransferase (peptidoglycan interpeptide bridge formation enzyme)
MWQARAVPDAEAAAWDGFVAGHAAGHFLQGGGWGRLRAGQGWRVARIAVDGADGTPAAGAQLLVRRSPLGPVGYVPRGPVCRVGDPAWPALLAGMRRALGPAALALRLEPHWADGAPARDWLTRHGLREVAPVQPPSTLRLDLAPEEAALFAGLKQKWRYNVRLAERHGVAVTLGTAQDLPAFGALMAETAARDGFHARPAGYYAQVHAALGPAARLYLAWHAGQLLAGILVVHFGDTATYLYGASSDRERQRMPNHLLQWRAIQSARAAGLSTYDFWGVPDALGRAAAAGRAPDDVTVGQGGLWGVWGFKRGFGGAVWRSVGAWDLPLAPRRYALAAWLLARRGGGAED